MGVGGGELLLLEALERLLVRPGLDGEVGLGVEANAEDDDGKEGGDVAGQLPVLPLARFPRRRRRPVEEVPLGALLVPRGRPPPGPLAAAPADARRAAQPCPQHPTNHRRHRPHRCASRSESGEEVVDLGAVVEVALWRLAAGWPASRLQEPGGAVNGLGLAEAAVIYGLERSLRFPLDLVQK